jgi:hypothetical protein
MAHRALLTLGDLLVGLAGVSEHSNTTQDIHPVNSGSGSCLRECLRESGEDG